MQPAVMPPFGREDPKPISVMVVDDSAVVRGVIGRLIETAPGMSVTASVASAAMALNALQRQRIDVAVLDIEMPEMDGITALPLLLAAQPSLKIVARTSARRSAR